MRIAGAVPAVMMLALVAAPASGQNCGSSLLAQTQTPAVFQGITLGGPPEGPTVARMWAAGSASQYSNATACAVGCAGFTASLLCVNSGNCIAVTGVNWLNTPCSTAGTRPTRTVFLVEGTTASSGGVWAAFNLDHNSTSSSPYPDPYTDSNYDLDVKARGNYSTASPYIGGSGQPITVTNWQLAASTLTLTLRWEAPSSDAERLNSSGVDLVKTYSVYYVKSSCGVIPGATGSKSNWIRVADTDGTQSQGYSTDTYATVTGITVGASDSVYVAIGLNFDGSGNPVTDSNTVASSYVSMPSLAWCPPPVPTPTPTPAATPTAPPLMPTPTPTATPTPTPMVPPSPVPTITPTPTRAP